MFTFLAGVDIALEGRYPPQRLKSPGQGLSSQRFLMFRDKLATVLVEQLTDFLQDVDAGWLILQRARDLAATI